MNKWLKRLVVFLLTIIGIFLIGNLPYLFFKNLDAVQLILKMIDTGEIENGDFLYATFSVNPLNYLQSLYHTLIDLFHLNSLTYYEVGRTLPLFPTIFFDYLYSMKVLLSALLISSIAAIFFSFMIIFMPVRTRRMIKVPIRFLQSIPDIFIVLLIQSILIFSVRISGKQLAHISSSYQEPAYLLPILSLSILPAFFIILYLVELMEDEEDQLYVELAKAKGISKPLIYIKHIFRNVFLSLFLHFKSIFWFSLSNLLMIEIIFNMNGILWFIWKFAPATPEITTLALLMIFIPFYFIFTGVQVLLERKGAATVEQEFL